MTHSKVERKTVVRMSLVLAAVVLSVGMGCQERNKCEELRDIAVERNKWCGSGEEITMGDLECSQEDANLAECVIPCFELPCTASADEFNKCLDACE